MFSSRRCRAIRFATASFSLTALAPCSLLLLLLFSQRFANDMVYIGLSYYGPSLGQNQYLSFLLSSVVEVPSCLVCWLLMDRWGRRWPLCLAMTLSGLSCIVTVTLPAGEHPESNTQRTLIEF